MLFQQASKERASALRKPASFNHRVMSNSGIATACNETGCQDPLEPLIASKHVLNLTGAAISSLDASVPDGGELAVLAKREFVPSISLPRQCTHVRHFAMGAYDLNLSSASSLTDTGTIFRYGGLTCQVGILFARCGTQSQVLSTSSANTWRRTLTFPEIRSFQN